MIIPAVPVVQAPGGCAEQIERWDVERLLVIDNTADRAWAPLCAERGWTHIGPGRNMGISGGWNLARSWFMRTPLDDDLLLLFSASVVWHAGLYEAAQDVADAHHLSDGTGGVLTDMAWHAIALTREVLVETGTWDENLWPGYYNDNDYGRRLELLGYHGGENGVAMPKVNFAEDGRASCVDARALKEGLIAPPVDFVACERYMKHKWNDTHGHGDYTTPFNLEVEVGWWSPLHRPGLEGVPRP